MMQQVFHNVGSFLARTTKETDQLRSRDRAALVALTFGLHGLLAALFSGVLIVYFFDPFWQRYCSTTAVLWAHLSFDGVL
jgi:hypothetical protein